jgi:mRNA interferase HicA
MERRDLVRQIEDACAVFIRHGGKHDWYPNTATKICQPVPRQTAANEFLAKAIIRKLSVKQPRARSRAASGAVPCSLHPRLRSADTTPAASAISRSSLPKFRPLAKLH